MDPLHLVFLNQRHDLKFVFKFRTLSRSYNLYSQEWLIEITNLSFLDKINVSQFRNLKKLKCSNDITDHHLQQLKHLTHLTINQMITNNGIKHLNLSVFVMNGNIKITDEGIEHMKLIKLNVNNNPFVTDKVIENMTTLKSLHACGMSGITNNGLVKLNLKVLAAGMNPKITEREARDTVA